MISLVRVFPVCSFEEASNLAIHGQLSEDSLASLDSKTSSIYQHSLLSAPQYFSRLLNHTLEDIILSYFLQGLIRFFSLRQSSNPELMLHVVSIYEDMHICMNALCLYHLYKL